MKEKVRNENNREKLTRVGAYALDYLIILMVTSIIAYYSINTKLGVNYIVLDKLPSQYRILYDEIAIVISLIFIIIIPLFNQGKTLGKTILKLNIYEKYSSTISKKTILIRQGLIIFLLGGILNPNYIYFVDILMIKVNNKFSYLQILANAISIFFICTFFFTKKQGTIYDRILNVKVNLV